MKARDLISKLQELPGDTEVYMYLTERGEGVVMEMPDYMISKEVVYDSYGEKDFGSPDSVGAKSFLIWSSRVTKARYEGNNSKLWDDPEIWRLI